MVDDHTPQIDFDGRYIFDDPIEPEGEEGEGEEGEDCCKCESIIEMVDGLLESTGSGCPLRSSYGGIPSSGGIRGIVEYGVGAVTVSEAAHCILGSLGRMAALELETDARARTGATKGHLAHIKEEFGIIEKGVKEYARPVYTRQMQEYESASRQVDEFRRSLPELKRLAKRSIGRLDPGHEPRLRELAEATYRFLIVLSDNLLESVQRYPEVVGNAFADQPVKTVTKALRLAVENLFDGYDYQ